MKRIFEDESEPLYGRPTSKFTLRPFTIEVMKQILQDVNPNYLPEDLLCLYAITGGVAKYIELLIDAKCYTRKRCSTMSADRIPTSLPRVRIF